MGIGECTIRRVAAQGKKGVEQKLIVVVLSQGAQLVHNSAKLLNNSTAAKVSSGRLPFLFTVCIIIAKWKYSGHVWGSFQRPNCG